AFDHYLLAWTFAVFHHRALKLWEIPMPLNRLVPATFAILAVAVLASPRPVAAQTVMKLASATINDVQHEWQKLFAADLQKRVGDKVKTEVYPASQLGPFRAWWTACCS